ncbi:hypothetical protein ACO0LL_26240 [Undibacterium sp. TC4M20W]|uniref:hypothetical protein n=1 Tax=unclassified Undibacterium TaxID=2630295 RepID=UPI003BEFF128
MNININFLRIPIYNLYYIDDVADFAGLSVEDSRSLQEVYDEEELKGIFEALAWAIKNPEYDFLSLLPNLRHSNEDIYLYLCKIERSLTAAGVTY